MEVYCVVENSSNESIGVSGDSLTRLVVIPMNTSSGTVTLGNGEESQTIYYGSAIHGAQITTFEIGRNCNGQWTISTGANVKVMVVLE